jgi:hypothetical protein
MERFEEAQSYTRTVVRNGQPLEEASVDSHTPDGREYWRVYTMTGSPDHPQPYSHTVESTWIGDVSYQRDCGRGTSECGSWRITSAEKLFGGMRSPNASDIAPVYVADEATLVQDDGVVTHIRGSFNELEATVFALDGDLDSLDPDAVPRASTMQFDVWVDNATGLPQRLVYGEGLRSTEVYFSEYDAVVIEAPVTS